MKYLKEYGPVIAGTLVAVWFLHSVVMIVDPSGNNSTGY